RLIDGAAVYHRFLPSHLRNDHKVLRNPYPVVKNKFYFALQAARPEDSVDDVLKECQRFADHLLHEASGHYAAGRLNAAELAAFEADVKRGVHCGVDRGLRCKRRSVALPPTEPEAFRPYPTLRPRERRLTVCFVSQEIPPVKYGGIGRFSWDLAQ